VGERGEFEGELGDAPPHLRFRSQPPCQRAQGQDGDGEGAVVAIGRKHGPGDPVRVERSGGAGNVFLGAFHHPGARPVVEREGGPDEQGGAEVAGAGGGIAPSAVGVGVADDPVEAVSDQGREGVPVDPVEGKDRHGGRERAGGQFPVPDAGRGSLGEEALSRIVERTAGLGPQIARDGRIGRHVFIP